MVTRKDVVEFLDDLLRPPPGCTDSSNNGLQVEGRCEVRKIVLGVDACVALFEKAAAADADFVIVHHGLSWGDNLRRLTGLNAGRIGPLFCRGISLYASHLPLDAHPEIGHNISICRLLGLRQPRPFCRYSGIDIGWQGTLPKAVMLAEFAKKVGRVFDCEPRVFPAGPAKIRRIGVVSGAGTCGLADAKAVGCDALLTGEIGHGDFHTVRELGIHAIAAGHYKTEIPGLQALAARLGKRFPALPCEFLDVPTGM